MKHDVHAAMLQKMTSGAGFIAALDQSGGSTPKALRLYGIQESEYSNDEQMFDLVHAMRSRIVTNAAFTGHRIVGAILFENTLERRIAGMPSSHYLWQIKQVVPFLKVDKGLAAEEDGVQLMKPMPGLDAVLAKANQNDVFGTKMRSVIKLARAEGIQRVVAQQFEIGKRILAAGLVPIVEPEVDINSPEKGEAESILKHEILTHLNSLPADGKVILKLTLPVEVNFYADLIAHERVVRVVALSGGYSRDEATTRLEQNNGMIASFSRALSEGLSAQQSDADFTTTLDASIEAIYQASLS